MWGKPECTSRYPLGTCSRAKRASPPRVGKPCGGSRSALAVTAPIDVDPLPAGREVKVKVKKSESEKVMGFWSFNFFETLIYFRSVFNLKRYMSKKVQNNFFMGLKIW